MNFDQIHLVKLVETHPNSIHFILCYFTFLKIIKNLSDKLFIIHFLIQVELVILPRSIITESPPDQQNQPPPPPPPPQNQESGEEQNEEEEQEVELNHLSNIFFRTIPF